MLGYAQCADDLALGRMVAQLATGDLGFVDKNGGVHISGRKADFAKIAGLRIDVQMVSAALEREGWQVSVNPAGEYLAVTVANTSTKLTPTNTTNTINPSTVVSSISPAKIAQFAAQHSGVPSSQIAVAVIAALPRLANGKVDREACKEAALSTIPAEIPSGSSGKPADSQAIFAALANIIAIPKVDPELSFAENGGDSLTMVQAGRVLQKTLGILPANWQRLPLQDVISQSRKPTGWRRFLDLAAPPVDTAVVLRAVAAIAILTSHLSIFEAQGGAHALLVLLGVNLLRFGLLDSGTVGRFRRLIVLALAVMIPTLLALAVSLKFNARYAWTNLTFVHWLLRDESSPKYSNGLWFIEVMLCALLVLAVFSSLPLVRSLQGSARWSAYAGFAGALLVLRFLSWPDQINMIPSTPAQTMWLAVLGVTFGLATKPWEYFASFCLLGLGLINYFSVDDARTIFVISAALILVFLPEVRIPRPLLTPVLTVAAASAHIYIVQFVVFDNIRHFPLFSVDKDGFPTYSAFFWAMTIGLAAWFLTDRIVRRVVQSSVSLVAHLFSFKPSNRRIISSVQLSRRAFPPEKPTPQVLVE